MASKIIVDQLEKTGGALTELTLPSVNGTANQYLKNDGSGGLGWVTPPAEGLSHVSQWRLTADFTGNATPLISNLVPVSTPVGYGKLPASDPMALDAFGKFTFPVTGTWYIIFSVLGTTAQYDTYESYIQTTTNNATYAISAWVHGHNENWTYWNLAYNSCLLNVTDTTQCKCDFNLTYSDAAVTTKGHADQNETYMTFIRLGDPL
jgi:hypothetical protein